MKKYDSYKKTSIGWLDTIPAHWTKTPIKYTVKNQPTDFIDGDWIESNVISTDGIRYLTTGNVGALHYKEQGNGFITEETFNKLNCTEVFPGDMLISRLNEPIGRTCIVPDLGYRIVVAVDNVIYRPMEDIYDKRYVMYQMNCKPYTENANFIARGSTMSRISRTMLGAIDICVPPLSEQQVIASYLDKKCGEIDKVVATQEKRIELLKELRQSIITRAVTRGINPDVKMRNSGVEWIGEVPEHWEVKCLKYCAETNSGSTPKNIQGKSNLSSTIIWIRTTDLNDNVVMDSSEYLSMQEYQSASCPWLKKGTVVVAMYGGAGTIGKCGVLGVEGTINQALCSLSSKRDNSSLFIFYCIKALKSYWMKYAASSRKDPNISQEIIRNIKVPVPPLPEQQSIVDYIERETKTLDSAITKAQKQIDLLTELKQSIITEVVTGKRKVC